MDMDSLDVLISKGIVKINGHEIPAVQVKSHSTCQVLETAVIPPYTEAVLNIKYDQIDPNQAIDGSHEAIIEPSESFYGEIFCYYVEDI